MALAFEVTCRSYAIEIDRDKFLDLMDSESYATDSAAFKQGERTLAEKLDDISGVSDIEYNGHFGAAVYLSISADEDNYALRLQISETIEAHLQWCAKLPKVDHVVERRRRRALEQGGGK
ncbi:hypothetical protein MesoLjLc_50950 [Mesorhizobium sp. L-8-10]|uniref:hypothetical protein n=1 Tax=Mesorhizobium sp. L-8-10 TaxID=2744523 RepID=UPI0019256E08|nr:hypothetical protein [Mesorhizobium sp. L-8-10]BCH33165.1 hypothetical protein MesoLjLc_50950 [Mesorhizobium sp. L-8-10]